MFTCSSTRPARSAWVRDFSLGFPILQVLFSFPLIARYSVFCLAYLKFVVLPFLIFYLVFVVLQLLRHILLFFSLVVQGKWCNFSCKFWIFFSLCVLSTTNDATSLTNSVFVFLAVMQLFRKELIFLFRASVANSLRNSAFFSFLLFLHVNGTRYNFLQN